MVTFGKPSLHCKVTLPTEKSVAEFWQLNNCPTADPGKFALCLLSLCFTNEELAESNCTPAEGRCLLNQETLTAIKCETLFITTTCYYTNYCFLAYHVNYRFPSENEEKRWADIVVKKLNGKCRGCRKQMKVKLMKDEMEGVERDNTDDN